MKQFLIEVDDGLAQAIERLVPARSRKRSEFIRMAIRKYIWDLEEQRTEAAYRAQPQDPNDFYFDPESWESLPPGTWERASRRRKSPRKK